MNAAHADLLIELGTEELPPKALRSLRDSFAAAIAAGLAEGRLAAGPVRAFASPRRLAVTVDAVAMAQEDRNVVQKGPPVSIAFDDQGHPGKAGLAFAKKCGVEIDDLEQEKSDAGEWLVHRSIQHGARAADLLQEIIVGALDALPVPRRMRWGSYDEEFVRPVHWLIVLHGDQVVPVSIFQVDSGRTTCGHRFHSSGSINIDSPGDYAQTLRSDGYVIADFDERRELIVAAVKQAARKAGGTAIGDDALYDEVTSLTEWPVAVTGTFDAAFLGLPKEVIIETLTSHQRYFPVQNEDGSLLPAFVTLANLESKDPDRVRSGNERVIQPRLADAAFFWDSDRSTPLQQREDGLKKVVYQQGLGSLYDKSTRVTAMVSMLAGQADADENIVRRAAVLSKCDLLTGMVGEFPGLQGVMGKYYATASGESESVADAIGEQYLPRFAGDALPDSIAGQILAVADRLDTLAGIFLLGKRPTGNRDPFGLRRAALGIVRILVEKDLDINFRQAVVVAAEQQPVADDQHDDHADAIFDYVVDRMRGYFVDDSGRYSVEMFESVRARRPDSLVDFNKRLVAIADFMENDAAASLAAAIKRTVNLLRKADVSTESRIDSALLQDDAERELFHALQAARKDILPLVDERAYAAALRRLAELRTPIDTFFDSVMVMAEDRALRENRLAILTELRSLFLDIADISRLTPAQT